VSLLADLHMLSCFGRRRRGKPSDRVPRPKDSPNKVAPTAPATPVPYAILNPAQGLRERYDIGRPLGTGASSVVHLATDRETGEVVAVKSTKLRGAPSPEGPPSIADRDPYSLHPAREGRILGRLNHPNIVRVTGAFEEPRHFHLVLEPLLGGDLGKAVAARGGRLAEAAAAEALRGLLSGLAYAHRHGIIHRDVKVDNLMLKDPEDLSTVRLIDFNFAVRADPSGHSQGVCGTVGFNAPEVATPLDDVAPACGTSRHSRCSTGEGSRHGSRFRSRIVGTPLNAGEGTYTSAVDVWSAGAVAYFLLTGEMPFVFPNLGKGGRGVRHDMWHAAKAMAHQYTRGSPWRRRSFEQISESAQDLVISLMQWDPEDRITAAEALEHPFFFKRGESLLASVTGRHNPVSGAGGEGGLFEDRGWDFVKSSDCGPSTTRAPIHSVGEVDDDGTAHHPLRPLPDRCRRSSLSEWSVSAGTTGRERPPGRPDHEWTGDAGPKLPAGGTRRAIHDDTLRQDVLEEAERTAASASCSRGPPAGGPPPRW